MKNIDIIEIIVLVLCSFIPIIGLVSSIILMIRAKKYFNNKSLYIIGLVMTILNSLLVLVLVLFGHNPMI